MIGELFASWMNVLTQPSLETYDAEKQGTSASKLLLALLLLGLVLGITRIPLDQGAVASVLSLGATMFSVVVDYVVIALVLFVIAKILGGRGDFLTHCYVLSLPIVPLLFINTLFGKLALATQIMAPLAPLGLERILSLVLGVYAIFLVLLALQSGHEIPASPAINIALIMLAVWGLLSVVAMFVAGADNVITKTVRFMTSNADRLLEQALSHAWLVLFSMIIAIILGVVLGVLITLPSRRPRVTHLLALIPLALFLLIYLGGDGTLGVEIEGFLNDLTSRVRGYGLIGVVLVLLLYVLYIFGDRAAEPVLYAAGIMLTFPSIGLFGLFIPLFGIGFVNAAVALILYAQLPILRNTYTGIREVPKAIIEAGRGMGMTEWEILYKVKLPMTVPVIMAGVRVSMVMIVGIAAIAKLIGVLCLGKYIFDGIGRGSDPMVIAGAVGVSVFALLVDGLLGWAQDALTPAGLRERAS
jgi:osmoprotectant transport system permease protein